MEFLIITSTEDKASINIRENILNSKLYSFKRSEKIWHENPLYYFEGFLDNNERNNLLSSNQIFLGLTTEPLIFLNNLRVDQSHINPKILIFASRHTSKTARSAILVHTTGNWSEDVTFGGNTNELSCTSALLQKAGYYSLKQSLEMMNLKDFRFDMEVTHHGPTNLEVPLIYMELGSSENEWIIKKGGKLVGDAIIDTIFKYLQYCEEINIKIGLGFGGTHYSPNFNKVMTHQDIALSFICPKYYIQNLNKSLITQMIDNTIEEIDYFIIDWKGTNSEDKKHLKSLLEHFDIPIKKTKDF
ncbi:MAG: D-aminoacyl-tRNA deacylase [Candidatus Lokiarchaeota archaeon]|jgi:D-aminoacyl-tRNA deacylase